MTSRQTVLVALALLVMLNTSVLVVADIPFAPGTTPMLPPAAGSHENVDLYGHTAVWDVAILAQGRNVQYYDLETGVATSVPAGVIGADQSNPAIFGKLIVYEDNRFGETEIFLYDIQNGRETQITVDNPSASRNPDIYGDWVVWEDYAAGAGNADIGNGTLGDALRPTRKAGNRGFTFEDKQKRQG